MTDELKPQRKKRTFSKQSRTWQLFERLFLQADASAYPFKLGPYTKGQALNLSIGLNTCHVQHKDETGMPEENMLYSAKPQGGKDSPDWYVEISTNYTRTGKVRPSREKSGASHAWMDELLSKTEGSLSSSNAPVSPLPKPVDSQEELLKKLYNLD